MLIFSTTTLICAEWGTAVKAILISIVSVVLCAVLALLVSELFFKKRSVRVCVEQSCAEESESAQIAADEVVEPEIIVPEQDVIEPEQEVIEPEQESVEPETVQSETIDRDIEEEEVSASGEVELDDAATIEDDGSDTGTVVVGDTRIKVRYNRSFTAAITQADDTVKLYYNELCNELLQYAFKSRMSWGNDSWYFKRVTYVKFAIRGKSLSMYLALDPIQFEETKYKFKDASNVVKYNDVPMQLRIKSDRAVKWAKELIALMAEKNGIDRVEAEEKNFSPDYRDTVSLVRDKLIKLRYLAASGKTKQELDMAAAEDLKAKDSKPCDFATYLMRADSHTKARYSSVKNELLRYSLTFRMQDEKEIWSYENIDHVELSIGDKALILSIQLDPKEVENIADIFPNSYFFDAAPMRVKIRSDKDVAGTLKLLAVLAEKRGLTRLDLEEKDYRYIKKKRNK